MNQTPLDTQAPQLIAALAACQDPGEQVQKLAALGRLAVQNRPLARLARGSIDRAGGRRLPASQLAILLWSLDAASPAVRRETGFALGELGDETIVERLLAHARTDTAWEVRAAAADALAKIGGPSAVDALSSIAASESNEDVVAAAIGGLAALALTGPSAAPAVVTTHQTGSSGDQPRMKPPESSPAAAQEVVGRLRGLQTHVAQSLFLRDYLERTLATLEG